MEIAQPKRGHEVTVFLMRNGVLDIRRNESGSRPARLNPRAGVTLVYTFNAKVVSIYVDSFDSGYQLKLTALIGGPHEALLFQMTCQVIYQGNRGCIQISSYCNEVAMFLAQENDRLARLFHRSWPITA